MNPLNIGEAAAVAGVTPKMIRHYESLGMIPDVQRTQAGYRLYSAREVGMLRFIRQSRALGFSVRQTDALLALWRDEHRASREVKELAQRHLAELEERQRELDEMRATLSALVAKCAGDLAPHCAILQELATAAEVLVKAPPSRSAKRTLKQVRPGSSAGSRSKADAARSRAAEAAPHSALTMWSRGLGRGR
jgi:Cu(I)-responsive transcriptional regulator